MKPIVWHQNNCMECLDAQNLGRQPKNIKGLEEIFIVGAKNTHEFLKDLVRKIKGLERLFLYTHVFGRF